MSENESQRNDPPKMSLNGKSANGNGLKKTDRLEGLPPAEAGQQPPPKVHLGGMHAKSSTSRVDIPQGRPADLKAETSRIDLAAAKPVEESSDLDDFGQTMRVDLSGPSGDARAETSLVDLSAGPAGAKDFSQTMRVEIPAAGSGDQKAKTSRLDLSQAKPSATGDSSDPFGRTMRVELGVPAARKSDTSKVTLASAHTQHIKGETQRADLSGTQLVGGLPQAKKSSTPLDTGIIAGVDESYRASNEATMRIELDAEEGGAGDTQRIIALSAPPQARPTVAEPAGRDRTTKVDLSEVFGSAPSDVFKRRSGAGEASGATPRTIRIRKPETTQSQPTRVLKRPPAEAVAPGPTPSKSGTSRINLPDDSSLAGPASQRKTIRIKRPGEAAPAEEAAAKTGTSRIDLPSSVGEAGPPSQRKTIRIKRPDAGTAAGRPMPVARPSGEAAVPPSAIRPAVRRADAPGLAYTIVAGFAVVIAATLVYVLAAQLNSIGLGQDAVPSWPFYGRIL